MYLRFRRIRDHLRQWRRHTSGEPGHKHCDQPGGLGSSYRADARDLSPWSLGAACLAVGVSLGVLSAVHQGSILDNALRVLAVMGNALPNFWFGLLLILVFGVVLGWLPTGGRQSVSLTNEFDLADRLRHLVLPTIVLAFGGIASLSRYMRTETLEVIRTDYIRMARAKGLAARRIWFIHALRNALIPLMTILGPAILGILSGAVITETVFSWPGTGRLTFSAAVQRDYPTVLGAVMFFSLLTILGNLLSDILYGVVDPRVRLA